MTYKVFTYGTLMKNKVNHHYVENSVYKGEAILDGYGLYDTGYGYPAAVKMDGFQVVGEIYEVDEETKAEMDILEDVDEMYACDQVKVHTDHGDEEALFYRYLLSTEGMRLCPNGKKWSNAAGMLRDYARLELVGKEEELYHKALDEKYK